MKHEFLLLLRARPIFFSLVALLITSAFAIYHGIAHTHAARQQITNAQALQHKELVAQKHALLKNGDAGEIGYYTFHIVYREPTPWGFISLGNMQSTPHVQRIRLLGLQAQLYDNDTPNPENAISGNFDFAFVAVFLLPLFCIALSYDLYLAERAVQRVYFIESLVASKPLFWAKRFLARWILLTMSVLLPLACVSTMQSLPVAALLQICALVSGYTMFWLLVGILISFGLGKTTKDATASATACLVFWLLLLVIIPGIAQIQTEQAYPAPSAAEITLAHRKKTNDAWDIPKADTFRTFFQAHPEWQATSPVTTRFHWKWYYAFHHVADTYVEPMRAQRERALTLRDAAATRLAWAAPNIALQRWLDRLAHHDLQHLIAYRKSVAAFHTRLRQYFYPFLFNEIRFTERDFNAIPVFEPAKQV